MSLLVNENSNVLWKDAIKDAENRCSVRLDNTLEVYLVSLLARYADKPEMVKRLFANALLQAMEKSEYERDLLLQRVGDECLLYSGLFPKSSKSKNVSVSYFVDIGRSAYAMISTTTNDLFDNLAIQFVQLMDVLQSIKPDAELLPLEAYEQWESVRSQRALRILQSYRKTRY